MSKKENQKIYEKALNLYNNGYINEAIEICEKGISRDLSNSNIVNLKGLLLYLKGNLKEATALWKINKDYNNDEISKTYLKDIEKDFIREELYKESEELINALLIDEAIKKLLECSKSDYNLINVNNALAICYMRKGEYDNSIVSLQKVFAIDKNNIKAKEIEKEINNFLNVNNKKALGLKVLMIALLVVIIATTIKTTLYFKERKIQQNNLLEESKINSTNTVEDSSSNETSNTNEETDSNKENTDKEVIKEVIKENENIERINLSSYEILENYNRGVSLIKEGKYKEAKEILEYTLRPSEGNDLNNDILFFLASSSEKAGDIESAIKYFEEFISKYNKGSYVEESYYRITLLYKEKDIEKSKYYANELISKFPKSIYNNNNIKAILAS